MVQDNRKELILDVMAGLISGALYLSYVLTFLFLIPVQSAYAARGRRSGIRSSLVALGVTLAGQLAATRSFDGLDLVFLSVSLAVPFALYSALLFIASPVRGLGTGTKLLLASSVLALMAAPFVIRATEDASFTSWMSEYVAGILASSMAQDAAETQALASAAVASSMRVFRACFAVSIFALVGVSWWFGSLRAVRQSMRNGNPIAIGSEAMDLTRARVPQKALWPTLLSWSALFAILALRIGGIAQTIAWNVSLCAASLYGVQGVGIIAHAATREGVGRLVRLAVPAAVLVAMLNTTAGIIVLILVPLLGITEVWFPYRNLKGAFK